MDSKERLIKNIVLKMCDQLDNVQLDILKNVLTIEMNNVDVNDSCREVTIKYEDNFRLLKDFLSIKKLEGLSDKSLERYYYENIKLLQFINKPIDKIECNDIRYFLAMKKKNGNSNVTLNGCRRIYSSFFSWLSIEDHIVKNPCASLTKIKEEKVVRKPLNEIELNIIRKSCKTDRDKALVEFLYSTGSRVSECVQVNINDIDFERKELIINGKGKKQRFVYMSDECINKLTRYINNRTDYSPALFVGKGTDRLSKNGIERIISNLGKVNGIHIFPHLYRHTFATNACEHLGINDVSELLGHSQIQTTLNYVHNDRIKLKERCLKYLNNEQLLS